MQHITDVLKRLYFLGDNRYAVGGCVRDYLLGLEPHDIDVATDLKPDEVMRRAQYHGFKVVPTGIGKGTVTIMVDGNPVEVTTYRRDIETFGRDVRVEFSGNLEDDLNRRDFTMNAMAMDINGNIIDPHNGRQDLLNKKLETVGLADDRFSEDYLRVIRGIRFMARFNLAPSWDVTGSIVKAGREVINHVSVERIVEEFNKAFQHDNAGNFFKTMYQCKVLQSIFPEFEGIHKLGQSPTYHPEGSVLNHVAMVIDNAPPRYRWHAMLHDIGKKDTAEFKERVFVDQGDGYGEAVNVYSYHNHENIGADMIPDIGKRLKLPNDLIDEIEVTTRHHMRPLHMYRNRMDDTEMRGRTMERAKRRFQVAVGEHLDAVEAVVRADRNGREGLPNNFIEWVFSPLDINEVKPVLMGRHLIERGYVPSPLFGKILAAAFEYQIEEGCTDLSTLLVVGLERGLPGNIPL